MTIARDPLPDRPAPDCPSGKLVLLMLDESDSTYVGSPQPRGRRPDGH